MARAERYAPGQYPHKQGERGHQHDAGEPAVEAINGRECQDRSLANPHREREGA
ncbi:hypothetical protein ABIE91_001079 [Bradyrhizobium elkanii]